MSNKVETQTNEQLLLSFGGFTVPAGCRRIFITAELEPANGDPRIQPTGFPDIGPVLYPDPSGQQGLICLIESEASMANRLEEVCLADKYTGTLNPALNGLPYIKLTDSGLPDGQLITTSTIDGHRFASEYIMGALGTPDRTSSPITFASFDPTFKQEKVENKATDQKTSKPGKTGKKEKTQPNKPELVAFVRDYLGMTGTDKCPTANVPNIFVLAMEYDPLSLIHGFQISVKNKLTFVGLRSPRALTASIVGLNCERLSVPGVRIDPIGTGDAGQAIFQKQRVTAQKIEARFSVDVGLLSLLRLDTLEDGKPGPNQNPRFQLLLAIALWKVSTFLSLLRIELSLRTECKLRLKGLPQWHFDVPKKEEAEVFPYETIAGMTFTANELASAEQKKNAITIDKAGFRGICSPLVLKFDKAKGDEEQKSNDPKQIDYEDAVSE